MIKLNDNTWFEPLYGLIIERDMHRPHTACVIRSVHSIPKFEVSTKVETVTDMIVLNIEGATGSRQPRIEDVPEKKEFVPEKLTVGLRKDDNDRKPKELETRQT